jgi:hypothetical protein
MYGEMELQILLFQLTPRVFDITVACISLLLVRCDFWYYGHYWPIVPAPDDR